MNSEKSSNFIANCKIKLKKKRKKSKIKLQMTFFSKLEKDKKLKIKWGIAGLLIILKWLVLTFFSLYEI